MGTVICWILGALAVALAAIVGTGNGPDVLPLPVLRAVFVLLLLTSAYRSVRCAITGKVLAWVRVIA